MQQKASTVPCLAVALAKAGLLPYGQDDPRRDLGGARNAVVKSGKLYVVQGQIDPAIFLLSEDEASPAKVGWVDCSDSMRKFGTR